MIFTALHVCSKGSLVNWEVQHTSFAILNELKSLVPELPADKNNMKSLTSQADSSGSADSRNINSKGKDISQFQQPFMS